MSNRDLDALELFLRDFATELGKSPDAESWAAHVNNLGLAADALARLRAALGAAKAERDAARAEAARLAGLKSL